MPPSLRLSHSSDTTDSTQPPLHTPEEEGNSIVIDAEWIIRKTFEQNAWEGCSLLFKKYYAPLCSHAMRLLYSRELAQDLVAEVFYEFWKNQLYTHQISCYRSYLFKTVRNRVISSFRKNLGEKVSLNEAVTISDTYSPEQQICYEELQQLVQRTVENLSPQCRRVFLMSRFESKSNQVIADEINISKRTVETHITHALAALRQAIVKGSIL